MPEDVVELVVDVLFVVVVDTGGLPMESSEEARFLLNCINRSKKPPVSDDGEVPGEGDVDGTF
jgi:hypothetical protein